MGWPASKDVQAYLLNRPVVLSFHEEVLSDRVKDEQALFFFLSNAMFVMVWTKELNANKPLSKCRK